LPIAQTFYITGLQNASLFGSYFVTFAIVAVNMLLAYALVNIISISRVRIGAIAALVLLVFQYGSGLIIYAATDVTEGEKIRIACIQGNISSSEKWDVSSSDKTLYNYEKYTVEAAREGADIVLWPETAIPYNLSEYEEYAELFAEMSNTNGVYILVGTYVNNEEGNALNSLVCFTPDGEQLDTVYSKRHLVPFGEYVPFRPFIETFVPPLAELVLSSDDIYPGEGAQIIETDEGIALGGLICFDSIYDELTLETVRGGAELICLSTNDSWFVDSVALDMHNAQAQIRAIESGRYVARAANTGISTVITPKGEVIERLEPLVEGKIVCDVYATDRTTVWSVIGNTFIYLLIIVFVCVIADNILIKIKQKMKQK
jgi:apolipoprotein N-acyltransferase